MAFDLYSTIKNDLDINPLNMTVGVVPQLGKSDYAKVKNLLNKLGGSWNTSRQHFEFTKCPVTLIGRALEAGGSSINKYQFYPTPTVVFDFIKAHTSVEYMGMSSKSIKVLEPSMGEAALMDELVLHGKPNGIHYDITGYEIDPLNVILAQQKGYDVTQADFLSVEPEPIYDLVLMNPPFQGNNYIKHIQHAQKFLSANGRLISVVPVTWLKNIERTSLENWLFEEAVIHKSTSLCEPEIFQYGTFEGVNAETMIVEIGSTQESQQQRMGETLVEYNLNLFELIALNSSKCLHEIEVMRKSTNAIDQADIARLVKKVCNEGDNQAAYLSDRLMSEFSDLLVHMCTLDAHTPGADNLEPVQMDMLDQAA